MKKLLGLLLGGCIGTTVLLGCIGLLGGLVEWLCVDKGRFILGLIILGYIVYKLMKEELDK